MKNRFLMVFRVCKKNMIFKIGKVLRLVFFTLAPGCGHQVPAPGPLVPGTRSSGPGDQVPAAEDLVLGPVTIILITWRLSLTTTLHVIKHQIRTVGRLLPLLEW